MGRRLTSSNVLTVGLGVKIHNHEGGWFIGQVTEVDDVKAVVTPASHDLQIWWPKGYDIGRAHWPAVDIID